MAVLPPDFQFSQASLQDYVDCRRRFLLAHVRSVAWPAVESEPFLAHERQMALGTAFHRLIWQHLSGVEPELLSRAAGRKPELARWWEHYQSLGPANLPGRLFPEVTLAAPLAGYRLLAKYDLLALDPAGDAVIVDWKTGGSRPPDDTLRARLQTLVYRYLLVRGGAHLNGGRPVPPARVRLVYWFAEHPDRPANLAYDDARYSADQAYLEGLVHTIAAADTRDFPRTDDERRCRFCRYRSLCGRGEAAAEGAWEDQEDASIPALALDFDQGRDRVLNMTTPSTL